MKQRIRKTLMVLGLAGCATLGGALTNTAFNNVTFARVEREVDDARTSLKSAADLSNVFKQVSKAVEPSVVQIQTKTVVASPMSRGRVPDALRRAFPFGPDGDPLPPDSDDDGGAFAQGTGSGVIMEIDGDEAFIVTNNHVVANANSVTVSLSDGRVLKDATVVGTDPQTDLAVVKVRADRLVAAKWGESSTLEKGDWVVAFGSPFGYVGSMTHGIVSALNRQVGILGRMGFEDFIQTDAPINPGNSGGPLVNLRGEVIGINSAILSRTGSFSGVGLAIPARLAQPVYQRLKSEGKVTRGWMGVSIADVSSQDESVRDMISATGFKGDAGVFVMETLRDGPAYRQLKAGDVITALQGKAVKNTRELREEIAATKPGTEVTLSVVREGAATEVKLTLGQLPEDPSLARASSPAAPRASARAESAMGMSLRSFNESLAKQHGLEGVESGAVVTEVQPGSLASRAGLRPGDVITRVNGKEVTTANDAAAQLKNADSGKGIRLSVTNKDGSRFVLVREK